MPEKFISKNGQLLDISCETPKAMEFNHIRNLVGWYCMPEETTEAALKNSLFCCSVRLDEKLIGFARVIGDGVMYFYVQDVMIHPEYQGQGIGEVIMQSVESWLKGVLQPGCTAALLAAEGKEGFYLKFDYQQRPGPKMGAGMSKFIR